jgi:type VI secretion system protein ImpE
MPAAASMETEGTSPMAEAQQTAGTLFRDGHLAEAVEAAGLAVKQAPADIGARLLLAELLAIAGNLERADRILDAATDIDPTTGVVVAEFRQLLRAEMARQQLRRDGRVPEFLGPPTPALAQALAARVALRAGDGEAAAAAAAAAEAARPHIAGEANGKAIDDFRDADDLHAGFFEVLTTTGKYFWIPTERVATATFHPPTRPRDLLWRRASLEVRDGPDGDVYLPVTYGNDDSTLAAEYRLGRATDWHEGPGDLVRGIGQRTFLAGDDALGIMEITSLRFGAPA